jgi:hypothetical protein
MLILDLAFSSFRWYRRLRGGEWWQVEIPLFDGSQVVWVHQRPDCKSYIIQTEKY